MTPEKQFGHRSDEECDTTMDEEASDTSENIPARREGSLAIAATLEELHE
jgi:hypothetical protein